MLPLRVDQPLEPRLCGPLEQQLAMGERTGGRHRACGLVQIIGQRIGDLGRETTIEHMHAHLPRVLKTASS